MPHSENELLNKELQQRCRAQGQYTKFSLLLYIQFFYFPYFKKFVIGGQFIYNIVLVSAMHQHESATGIHMFPPSVPPFPPSFHPPPLGHHRVSFSNVLMSHEVIGSILQPYDLDLIILCAYTVNVALLSCFSTLLAWTQ